MGRLAKLGIIHGKTVPVEGLLQPEKPRTLDPFSKKCLVHFGFAGIAEKILRGADLSVEEIEALIAKASMTILMKLTELKNERESNISISPVVSLPIETWLEHFGVARTCRRVTNYLEQMPQQPLHIFVELSDFSELLEVWEDLIADIQSARPDIVMVGPSVERIISWISLNENSKSKSLRAYRLERILFQLKEIGFNRLRESSYRGVFKMMNNAGFENYLATRLDQYSTPAMLARELYRINKVTRGNSLIKSWSPVIGSEKNSPQHAKAALVVKVMRALAVGSLALNFIPYRSACGSHLSLQAIRLLSNMGANGNVFGAVDTETEDVLGIHSFESLEEIFAA